MVVPPPIPNPKGIAPSSPRLASQRAYPGNAAHKPSTTTWLRPRHRRNEECHNRVAVENVCWLTTQGSAFAQPWALGRNLFGIPRAEAQAWPILALRTNLVPTKIRTQPQGRTMNVQAIRFGAALVLLLWWFSPA